MASQHPPNIDTYRDDYNHTTREVIRNLRILRFHSNFFKELRIPPIKEQTLKFFLNNCDETKCLKVMKKGFQSKLPLTVAKELLFKAKQSNYCKII